MEVLILDTFEFLVWDYGRLWRCSQLDVSGSICYDILRRWSLLDDSYRSLLFRRFSSYVLYMRCVSII